MSGSTLPKLLVSLAEAQEKITAQIKRGGEVLGSITSTSPTFGFGLDTVFDQAQHDQEKWAKYTIQLLQTLFSDTSIAQEFGRSWIQFPPHEDMVEVFVDAMKGKIRRLESILERLPLFPSAEKPVQAKAAPAPSRQQSKDIFIVHGHDEAAKHEVARVIEKLDLRAIILHEQADKGRTIIEKFEHHSAVGFAVVLLTPDDVGHPKDNPDESKPRARQNVVFELGCFIGILGRSRVCALLKGDIEIPTDLSGVLYTPMDDAGVWKFKLAREIKAAGIDVDLNKLT
jgi:predicted nucleotide-binding protein